MPSAIVVAPAGRYMSKPTDHQVIKGYPSCQSSISPWSKILFYNAFRSTLAYVILCARGSLFPLSIFLFLSLILPLFPLSFVGAIGFGCDRSGVGVLAIGRHVGVALLLFPNSVGVCCDDSSVEGLFV